MNPHNKSVLVINCLRKHFLAGLNVLAVHYFERYSNSKCHICATATEVAKLLQ